MSVPDGDDGVRVTEYTGALEELMVQRSRSMGASPLAPAAEALTAPVRGRTGTPGWVTAYRAVAVTGDGLVAAAAALVCYLLRFGAEPNRYLWLVIVAPVIWVAVLYSSRVYDQHRFGAGAEEYRAIGRAGLLLVCGVALVSYVFHAELARGIMLPLAPMVVGGSLLAHWQLRNRLNYRRRGGECLLATVVVGRADSVASMIREITTAANTGFRIVGACVSGLDAPWATMSEIEGVPIYGPPETALSAVDALGADVVAVSSHPDLVGHSLRRLGWALAERQVELVVAPGIVEVAGPRLSLRPAAGMSLLHVERPVNDGAVLVLKRVFDTTMALLLAILALPACLLIVVLVKVGTPGPVLFRQERVGTGGARFGMYKFRTMVENADRLLAEMPLEGQINSVLFKQPCDPRVTPVGRVLRRYSLDELPQLINVLLGDMSLVGPRPPLPREVDAYEPDAVQRLRVRPGMTGLWQISGRSDLSWEQSLRLDLWYVDNWSPVLDLQILVRTFRAVFGGSGAY